MPPCSDEKMNILPKMLSFRILGRFYGFKSLEVHCLIEPSLSQCTGWQSLNGTIGVLRLRNKKYKPDICTFTGYSDCLCKRWPA